MSLLTFARELLQLLTFYPLLPKVGVFGHSCFVGNWEIDRFKLDKEYVTLKGMKEYIWKINVINTVLKRVWAKGCGSIVQGTVNMVKN